MSLNQFLVKLAFSNFFLVSSYSFLALHTLFIHEAHSKELKTAVYIGFGLYNGLQVGGVWAIKKLFGEVGLNRYFFLSLRLIASVLLFIATPISIITSYLLFGLSSASYFKISREYLKDLNNSDGPKLSNPYVVFSISTNLSFVVMPFLGSMILEFNHFVLLGVSLNIMMSFTSFYLFPKYSHSSKQIEKESASVGMPLIRTDFFRLLFTLLPYAVMITLPPLKAKEAGLSSEYSSYLYTINGLAVVLIQVFLSRSELLKFSFKKYDLTCVIATVCFVSSYFLSYQWFVMTFVIWSIVETYQIPSLEYLLFGERNYSEGLINRLLIIDAFVCVIGPVLNTLLIAG